MKRRTFITLLGGAAAWPLAAHAQQATDQMRRIGVLTVFSKDDPEGQRRVAALLQKLQELGWTDGRNVRIELRWGGGDPDRSRFYAGELVGMKPDVILVNNAVVLPLLQNETHTIPIVLLGIADPVAERASRGQAATSLGFPMPNMRSAAKSSKFSRKLRPTSLTPRSLWIRDNPITSASRAPSRPPHRPCGCKPRWRVQPMPPTSS